MKWTRKVLAEVDANVGGGAGKQDPAPKDDGQKPPAVVAKEEYEALQAKLKKAEEDLSKRRADEKKVKEQEEVEKGRAKDVIAAKEAELAAAKEKADKFEAKMRERAEANYSKLPKEKQAKLDKYKETLGIEQWSEMVDDELAEVGAATTGATQFVGTAGKKAGEDGKKYEPTNKAIEILDRLMKTPDTLRSLTVVRDPEGRTIFTDPIANMFQKMKRGRASNLNSDAAEQRRRR